MRALIAGKIYVCKTMSIGEIFITVDDAKIGKVVLLLIFGCVIISFRWLLSEWFEDE